MAKFGKLKRLSGGFTKVIRKPGSSNKKQQQVAAVKVVVVDDLAVTSTAGTENKNNTSPPKAAAAVDPATITKDDPPSSKHVEKAHAADDVLDGILQDLNINNLDVGDEPQDTVSEYSGGSAKSMEEEEESTDDDDDKAKENRQDNNETSKVHASADDRVDTVAAADSIEDILHSKSSGDAEGRESPASIVTIGTEPGAASTEEGELSPEPKKVELIEGKEEEKEEVKAALAETKEEATEEIVEAKLSKEEKITPRMSRLSKAKAALAAARKSSTNVVRKSPITTQESPTKEDKATDPNECKDAKDKDELKKSNDKNKNELKKHEEEDADEEEDQLDNVDKTASIEEDHGTFDSLTSTKFTSESNMSTEQEFHVEKSAANTKTVMNKVRTKRLYFFGTKLFHTCTNKHTPLPQSSCDHYSESQGYHHSWTGRSL